MNVSQILGAAMLNAGNTLYNGGTLVPYIGTQPSSPETALASGNTSVGSWTFSATAFAAATYASGEEMASASFTSTTLNPTSSPGAACTFARAFKSDGTTALADYTIGVSGSGADIIVGNATFQTGVPVVISSFVNQLPAV